MPDNYRINVYKVLIEGLKALATLLFRPAEANKTKKTGRRETFR
jgi:hypothetical protein